MESGDPKVDPIPCTTCKSRLPWVMKSEKRARDHCIMIIKWESTQKTHHQIRQTWQTWGAHPTIPDVYNLIGTKGNINNHFTWSWTSNVYQCLILGRILRANNIRIILLEEFMEPKFIGTMFTVTKKACEIKSNPP